MEREEVLFEIDGYKIYKGRTYQIAHKPDPNAPSGFQAEGCTKLPDKDVNESFRVRFQSDATNPEKGVWDTGFYKFSPCYRAMTDRTMVEKTVESLMKNLVEPYRQATGLEDAFDEKKDDINSRRFHVQAGETYDVSIPEKAIELYFILFNRKAVPKERKKDPRYLHASYTLIDSKRATTVANERAQDKYRAIKNFQTLLERDKDGLFKLLEYVDIRIGKNSSDDQIIGMFDMHINREAKLIGQFNDIVDKSATDSGKLEVEIYFKLKEMMRSRNSLLVKVPSGVFVYDTVEIGPDLKTAAKNINLDPNMRGVKDDIVLSDDN